MKKRADIYFLIYLATLMSFFAIEAELGDYQDHQKDILLQVANERIEDLVHVTPDYGNNFPIPESSDEDKYRLNMEISGDFLQTSLQGKAKFTILDTTREIDPISVPLLEVESTGSGENYYSILTDLSIFGDYDTSMFKISLELEGDLEITDETYDFWIDSYGSEDVADVIKHNIESMGSFSITKHLDALVIPKYGVKVIPPFDVSLGDESVTTIQDIPWVTKIFIQGVSDPNKYDFSIIKGKNIVSDISYSGHQVTLTGKTSSKSVLRFNVTRLLDGLNLTRQITINVTPPMWESSDLPDEIYFGDKILFDGRVKGISSTNTCLELSGVPESSGTSRTPAAVFLGPYSSKGTITVQAMYGNYAISSLSKTINIKSPPPPKPVNSGLYGNEPNTYHCNVTVYGAENALSPKKLIHKSGVDQSDLIDEKSENGRTVYHFWFKIAQPNSGSTTPVEIMVQDKNSQQTTVEWELLWQD